MRPGEKPKTSGAPISPDLSEASGDDASGMSSSDDSSDTSSESGDSSVSDTSSSSGVVSDGLGPNT